MFSLINANYSPRSRALHVLIAVALVGCGGSKPSTQHASALPKGVTIIDPKDTAAYSILGPDAVAAVARCQPPACRPDIHSGPAPGELTIGLDSANSPGKSFRWHQVSEPLPPGAHAVQDADWIIFLSQWDTAASPPLFLVDGVPRTLAYTRANVNWSMIWGVQQLSAADAKKRSSNPAAANGAVVITTKAHAPPPPR